LENPWSPFRFLAFSYRFKLPLHLLNARMADRTNIEWNKDDIDALGFLKVEDETGFTNLVVFQSLFDKYRKEILQAKLLMVEGRLQREGMWYTLL
jgi:DNA polymerase III alpha subunit